MSVLVASQSMAVAELFGTVYANVQMSVLGSEGAGGAVLGF